MDNKIWYKCDPNKNKECNKRSCAHNPNAIQMACQLTDKKEYSIDGIPSKALRTGTIDVREGIIVGMKKRMKDKKILKTIKWIMRIHSPSLGRVIKFKDIFDKNYIG